MKGKRIKRNKLDITVFNYPFHIEDLTEEHHEYYKCPECGRILNPQDNSRTIEHLKTMIAAMEASA